MKREFTSSFHRTRCVFIQLRVVTYAALSSVGPAFWRAWWVGRAEQLMAREWDIDVEGQT